MDARTRLVNMAFVVQLWLILIQGVAIGSPSIVGTIPSVALQKGRPGSLPCIAHTDGYIYTVSWLKGQTYDTAEYLISMDTYAQKGYKDGPGFDSGSYDIDDNFSLLIKEVDVENGGRYICQVTPIQTGILARNHTEVTVYAEPHAPYPTITEQECLPNVDDEHNCSITVTSSVELTCMITGYYPTISLFFRNSLGNVPALESKEWDNEDESKSKYVTILAVADNTAYQCVASNIPGPGNFGERVATIMVMKERNTTSEVPSENETPPSNFWKVYFYILIAINSSGFIAYLVDKWRQRRNIQQQLSYVAKVISKLARRLNKLARRPTAQNWLPIRSDHMETESANKCINIADRLFELVRSLEELANSPPELTRRPDELESVLSNATESADMHIVQVSVGSLTNGSTESEQDVMLPKPELARAHSRAPIRAHNSYHDTITFDHETGYASMSDTNSPENTGSESSIVL